MAYGARLESVCAEMHRGFESRSLRKVLTFYEIVRACLGMVFLSYLKGIFEVAR